MIKRGKFKRAIALLLAVCVLCCTPALAAKKPSKATVRKAYQSYIMKYLDKAHSSPGYIKAYYDINKDGVEELIFEYGAGVRCGFKIYTYKNKKVKKLHSNLLEGCSGAARIKGKKYLVLFGSAGWGDSWMRAYTISSKGKLKKAVSYQAKAAGKNPNGSYKVNYYKNGKKCKKKTYTDFEKSLIRIYCK